MRRINTSSYVSRIKRLPRSDSKECMVSVAELANFVVDPDECDPRLHQAAFSGNVDEVQELLRNEELKQNVDLKARPFGATPLRLAATGGFVPCVRLLLAEGADVNATDFKAQTPLFVAIKNRHASCARVLLEAGAEADGDSHNRCSPLYIACQAGFIDGVKLLLEYGATTEIPYRLTHGIPGLPLHVAILYQHYPCVLELLQQGAVADLRQIQPPLPETVIAQISLPHAIVRYGSPVVYAHTLVLFGGNLWQRDMKNRLATEIPDDCESRTYIANTLGMPMSLYCMCRIAIRRHVGRSQLPRISSLPLPSSILDFLEYKELKDISLVP